MSDRITVTSFLLIMFSVTLLATRTYNQDEQLDAQAPLIEREHERCSSVRDMLLLTRRKLQSRDVKFARALYDEAARDGWLRVNTCMAAPIDDACDVDDLPCKLHALDWALVNIQ